jgi:diguanylate cyclase (GGDEF)-like protein/PAS domain S-box-containing protein
MSNMELTRLATLHDLGVLDSPPSPELDRITRIARRVFAVPIALVSLVDCDRQWFKARTGLAVHETPRDISFCTHAVERNETFVVEDTHAAPRFADNPLVTGAPGIRFYAGRPLRSLDGLPLGTLCVIDRVARHLDDEDRVLLDDLATLAEQYFHARESQRRLERARRSQARTEALYARIVEQASAGIALVSAEGRWLEVNAQLARMLGYAPAQLLGMTFQQITHADDVEDNVARFRRLLANDIAQYTIEKRFVRADGRALWTQVSVSRLVDPLVDGPRVIMVATDIDARKQMELDLAALRAGLEQRVAERTAQLNDAVATLTREAEQRRSAEQRVYAERERFHATLENATDAFVEVDASGRIEMWNRAAEQIFGWSKADAIGRVLGELIVPRAQRAAHAAGFAAALATRRWKLIGRRIEMTAQRKNGQPFPVEMTLGVTTLAERTLVSAFLQDISQRKLDEKTIRQANLRLKTITDNLPALIGYLDANEIYRFHNRQHEVFFGGTLAEIDNRHVREIFGAHPYEVAQPYLRRALAGEEVSFEFQTSERANRRWLHIHLVPDRADEPAGGPEIAGAYVLATDITAHKRYENTLRHAATHDSLTGLPNRRSFVARLDAAMAYAREQRTALALIFFDLDDFKQINDQYGHDVGDAVLRRIATIARGVFRAGDFVARLAGDEFVALLEHLPAAGGELEPVCTRLVAQVNAVQEIDGRALQLSASVGAALASGEIDSATLLARADEAMYRAKRAGKNRFVITTCRSSGAPL